MKQSILYFLPVFLPLISCSSDEESGSFNDVEYGNYYFEYDQIDHYRNEITEDEVNELFANDSKSENKLLFESVLSEYYPKDLSDTLFLKHLKGFGYSKKRLSQDKQKQIKKYFRELLNVEVYAYSCIAVFRDILVFRLNGKISGIAKICFSCDQKHIIGTDANTESFGMLDGYSDLNELLDK